MLVIEPCILMLSHDYQLNLYMYR